jgi:hypothetical protein
MSTITGTVTASTVKVTKAINDDALVRAMQTMSSRLIEVTKSRVQDDTASTACACPRRRRVVPFPASLNTSPPTPLRRASTR